jgi:hypothetical protein
MIMMDQTLPLKTHPNGLERLKNIRWLGTPLLIFLVTRLGIALIAYFSLPLIVDSNVPPYHIKPDQVLLDVFGSRWDTGFYLSIADEGYKNGGVQFPSVAFFPLLPILLRTVSIVTGDGLIAGLIVTNLALIGAVLVFYRLVGEEFGAKIADRATWYFMIFPTSFFGSAIYSESLFLLGSIGALYLFRKHHWIGAAMMGILTAMTRLTGILLVPLLFLEWWSQYRRNLPGMRPSRVALLVPMTVPLGTLAYMFYLQMIFGDPLAFLHASAAWGRGPRSPLATIAELVRQPAEGWASAISTARLPLDNWLDLSIVVLFLGLGCALLWQRRWGEGAFVLLGALIGLSSGLLMSQRRYVWMLFPAFILLARWGERPWVDRVIVTLSLLGLGLFTAMFANWYWVG